MAHYAVDNDKACLAKLRDLVAMLPRPANLSSGRDTGLSFGAFDAPNESASTPSQSLYDLLPADHRMSYDMHDLLKAVLLGLGTALVYPTLIAAISDES